ncbi:MAG TPA: hypothetical protein VMU16_03115 [Candidatus Binataceae bacterium]|nr:hypothetical protein [Candidatus Binataceae bacterium]
MLSISLPARINVVGNPTDALEGAYATISAAIDRRGGSRIRAADGLEFCRASGEAASFPRHRITDPHGFDIEAAAVNALLRYSPEFAAGLRERGAAISTWTDIPISSGLAGSSVLLLAVLAALRAFYELDRRRYNDYVLAEIAQRAEEHEMGIVCGFADRYLPLFGGIAYLGYHGKLWHAALGEEPFAAVEPLSRWAPPLRFCIAITGVQRNSGITHTPMRARYLEERRRGSGPLLKLARQIGETAWRGKIALLSGDLNEFGAQITRNQELIDTMMHTCGFPDGTGVEVRGLIAAAHEAGALGAKLTGAGGGGAIFALPAPGQEEALAQALRTAAQRIGLTRTEVVVIPVTETGLKVEA